MVKKRNEIRSTVGSRGMMIYTPDQSQVCIACDLNGDSYNIRNEPAYLWEGREELFHITYEENYLPRESIGLIIRLLVEFMAVGFLGPILRVTKIFSERQSIGIVLLAYGLIYILEFSIFRGLQRRKSERGRMLLRLRGALNKAINAFEKKGKEPTLEDVKKASIFRADRDRYLQPHELAGIFLVFAAISFFMPTVILQIISIPILVFIMIMAYKTSLFGVLRLTYVAPPNQYELKMAQNLVEFWYSVSYKDSPKAKL